MAENSAIFFYSQNSDFDLGNGSLTLFPPYFLKNHPFSPLNLQTFTPKGCSGKGVMDDKI